MAFKVVGHAAHVRTSTPDGRRTILLYKGSSLPPDVPADQIAHLLSVGLIAGSEDRKTVSGSGPSGQAGGGSPSDEQPSEELSEERKAAQDRLPADGSLPSQQDPKAVWVEAAVKRGYAYEAASAATKAELVALLKS